MTEQAIQQLKNLETHIYFLQVDIPHKSCMVNREIMDILANISSEIEKTVNILEVFSRFVLDSNNILGQSPHELFRPLHPKSVMILE
jgi:hypothetical protein